jgi:hypothetical protein
VKVRLYRNTGKDIAKATFNAGSSIKAEDLNNNVLQALFSLQEIGTVTSNDEGLGLTAGSKGDIHVNSGTDWYIKDDAIESQMLNTNSVTTDAIANNAVTVNEIANNAVEAAKLGTSAVETAKIKDDAVTDQKIPNNEISLAKLTSAAIAALGNPIGTVIWYAGSSAPTGYLKANGDTIANGSGTTQSITADFSALYAVVGGTLPDLRGEFIRGFDDGKGTDNGRSIRSGQTELFKEHTHNPSVSQSTTGAHNHAFKASNLEGDEYSWSNGDKAFIGDSDGNNFTQAADTNKMYDNGSHNHSVGVTIANTGGNESRPRNIALLACIKY